jgi:hypothetical protein
MLDRESWRAHCPHVGAVRPPRSAPDATPRHCCQRASGRWGARKHARARESEGLDQARSSGARSRMMRRLSELARAAGVGAYGRFGAIRGLRSRRSGGRASTPGLVRSIPQAHPLVERSLPRRAERPPPHRAASAARRARGRGEVEPGGEGGHGGEGISIRAAAIFTAGQASPAHPAIWTPMTTPRPEPGRVIEHQREMTVLPALRTKARRRQAREAEAKKQKRPRLRGHV